MVNLNIKNMHDIKVFLFALGLLFLILLDSSNVIYIVFGIITIMSLKCLKKFYYIKGMKTIYLN